MKVWFIEDEEDDRKQFERDIREALPDIELTMFDAAFSLHNATGSPDVIIIDVAGASGLLSVGCSWAGMLSPIRSIVQKYPGANYGFYSAVGSYAKDAVDDLKEENPEMVAEFIDSWETENFIAFIRKWS